tara:strand:- start:486 stop:593 length:108 start_codon:yes stop_codon:yes gene_type:complete
MEETMKILPTLVLEKKFVKETAINVFSPDAALSLN